MIHTMTINPAIDKLIFVKELKKDNTNRILETCDSIGGKGTHVSINLSLLGKDSNALGICYGENGLIIKKMLRQYPKIKVNFLHYEDGNSRTNYVIVEENHICTLITERGQFITKEICDSLIQHLKMQFNYGDYLVISGHAGNTEIPFIYNVIMDSVKDRNPRIFFDTSSEDLIEGIRRKPFMIKPNEEELSQVMGRSVKTEEDVLEGIDYLSKQGIECIVVSRGAKGSIAKYNNNIYKVYSPKVNVISTIGCGDALLSGIVYGFNQKMEFEYTLKLATAISAATAESKYTVGFDYNRAISLIDEVRIQKI